MGKELARSAQSRLNLIGDKEAIMLPAEIRGITTLNRGMG